MEYENTVSIRVWGDFACFTRPEMKVERVSYPVMTPSAARGILEAIFWEPQMYYLIDSIRIVRKGYWLSVRRNEVIDVINISNARKWMNKAEKFKPIKCGGGIGAQRNMLALSNVDYIVTAKVELTNLGKNSGQTVRKYLEEIRRRSEKGKCHYRPSLGMREFDANFEWVADPEEKHASLAADMDYERPGDIWPREDLGLVLYDIFYHEDRQNGFRWFKPEDMAGNKRFEGRIVEPRAAFFRAKVEKACVDCNPERVRILVNRTEGGG